MTLDRLIEILEDCREELGGDADVRLMSQPSYPFEYGICGVATSNDFGESEKPVAFILEGGQLAYGDSDAWTNCSHED